MLHSILCKVPQSLDLDELISDAVTMQQNHPPESLPSWGKVSRYSVLKTARDAVRAAKQTSTDGARLFEKQVTQLRALEARQDAIKVLRQYQRPAITAGLAIVVGIIAWRMRGYVW